MVRTRSLPLAWWFAPHRDITLDLTRWAMVSNRQNWTPFRHDWKSVWYFLDRKLYVWNKSCIYQEVLKKIKLQTFLEKLQKAWPKKGKDYIPQHDYKVSGNCIGKALHVSGTYDLHEFSTGRYHQRHRQPVFQKNGSTRLNELQWGHEFSAGNSRDEEINTLSICSETGEVPWRNDDPDKVTSK